MSQVSQEFQPAVQALIEELSQQLVGVKFIVVTSIDGFELASTQAGSFSQSDAAKVAAMSSSISAIGSMAVKEVAVGNQYESIIIEGNGGYILILELPHPKHPLVMSLIASEKAILGQMLYQAKQTVTRICELQ